MEITYLFGAGASANTIPVVNNLNKSMRKELKTFRRYFKKLPEGDIINPSQPDLSRSLVKQFIEDYEWVITASEKHQSIDTFAKKLYIQGKLSELKKLKVVITIYFIIIQSKRRFDSRYDSFFASILQETRTNFPPNLKIISWNYDYQLEQAYGEYLEDYRFDSCNTNLQIVSKNSDKFSKTTNNFGILKLNGTASFMLDVKNQRQFVYLDSVNREYNEDLLYSCFAVYSNLIFNKNHNHQFIPSLSFAWEDDRNTTSIIDKAIKFVKETRVLVVVGYSFPLFNRNIDRKVIQSMIHLKTVYFQAPNATDLKERFLAIKDDIDDKNLLIRKDCDQFVFPNEF